MPKYCILLFVCNLIWTTTQAQKDNEDIDVNDYIAQYKDIAVQEMERSGIPASITLAQGIHESAYGNSELARKAKNHFGIKCTKDWKGKTMYKWDDEARKSCFRFYPSAEDSYVDHTDFLMNRRHYAFLFNYDRTDYKHWAKGLKKAGYATDPRYPEKLIKTIELYQLQQYDKVTGVLAYDTTKIVIPNDLAIGKRHKPRSFFFKRYKPGFFRTNDASYAISRKGESALAAAKRFGIPYKRFLKFNDLEDGDELIDYQPIYIQPKKAIYKGEEEVYKVEKDITMYEISQEFGVKLSSLLAFNLMKQGEEPQNGEMVQLKNTATAKPKLRPRKHIDLLPSPYVEEDKTAPLKTPVKSTTPIVIPKVERPKPAALTLNTPTYDPVVYADTTRINTAKSKNKAFLNAQIAPPRTTTGTTSTTTVVRRRPATNNAPDANNSNSGTTRVKRRPATTTPPANTTTGADKVIRRPVNDNASNQGSTVVRRPQNNPNPAGNTVEVPQTNKSVNTTGFNNAGSTRDYNKSTNALPEQPQKQLDETPANTVVIQPLGKKGISHTVKKGETLYSIHRLYDVPVAAIQGANQLTDTQISIGQKLKIPVK
ncbi:MAG: glucosaminidase domain-containing protein [Aureispira sp.]